MYNNNYKQKTPTTLKHHINQVGNASTFS